MGSFGKYKFLPWSRRGISAYIEEEDTLGKTNGVAVGRAQVPVTVHVNADVHVSNKFNLLGPGDLAGIVPDMVIRTEPLDGISNFEPNYLPFIEFYDEDFPWRYTPAHVAGTNKLKLRPWLALVVLKEDEFINTDRRKPLPSIQVLNTQALPPHDELHLWAHTHLNMAAEKLTTFEEFLDDLQADAKTDPDGLFSRLMCPRHLAPDTLYHAFLVPTYETGRLAGLGRSIKDVKAQQPSWGAGSDNELPVYFRWFFRTGQNFDFEYLVKLLEPRIMDKRVGMRPMDCSMPGFVQADSPQSVSGLELTEPLLLEGALKAPSAQSSLFPETGVQYDFLDQLKKLVNLNRKLFDDDSGEDPFVTVPFYGMYHAMTKQPAGQEIPEFDPNEEIWYDDLNRDPRNRVPAGFGVRVVQENQEKFMDFAWKQLKSVLEHNRKMQATQMVAKVSERMYKKHIQTLPEEKLLSISRPMSARILTSGVTIKYSVQESLVPGAVFSHPFRRITRNQSALLRGLTPRFQDFQGFRGLGEEGDFESRGYSLKNLVSGLNTEGRFRLSAAPEVAFEAVSGIDLSKPLSAPQSLDDMSIWTLQSNLDPNFIYNLDGFTGGLPDVGKWNFFFGPGIFETGGLTPPLNGNVMGGGEWGNTFDVLSGNFGTKIDEGPVIRSLRGAGENTFDEAYAELNASVTYVEAALARMPLAITEVAGHTLETVRPGASYVQYLRKTVRYEGTLGADKLKPDEDFLPAMAYPDFPEPTYEYLLKIDKQLLIPNLELIPPDTISLLRTNQKFIESYLLGLNFEMGREMLWREYPTDMRGSYFRQFWDVRGFVTPATTALGAEDMKDIKPIHTWKKSEKLGCHNARDPEADPEQLVFVVRGELLKKFPNTVIYAQKAFLDADGKTKKIREHTENPKEILFPIYQAEIQPDIKLLGFNLTIAQAAGVETVDDFPGDHEGWFFIIAEVPGEPRFGMDISFNPNLPTSFTWNDLSWENFGGQNLSFIRGNVPPGNTGGGKLFSPPNSATGGTWDQSSADMAAILFQRPVMIATHATEMLDQSVIDDAKNNPSTQKRCK